jgi:AcrR family transcriptional regulator
MTLNVRYALFFIAAKKDGVMARSVNEQEYNTRRNEILDTAQRFIYTKGYEQMTIQDILDDRQISKGAFFHYFPSKRDLLEALIERMTNQAEEIITPIVNDTESNALQKLQNFFDSTVSWKTQQVEFLLVLLKVWYADDNAIVRQKVVSRGLHIISPLMKGIVLQGIQEGVMHTDYPDHIIEVVYSLMFSFGDALSEVIIAHDAEKNPTETLSNIIEVITKIIGVYNEALERILGAPQHSLNLVDVNMMKKWLVVPVSVPEIMN